MVALRGSCSHVFEKFWKIAGETTLQEAALTKIAVLKPAILLEMYSNSNGFWVAFGMFSSEIYAYFYFNLIIFDGIAFF